MFITSLIVSNFILVDEKLLGTCYFYSRFNFLHLESGVFSPSCYIEIVLKFADV
ncbi:hypothetical protein Lalb_Chr22g0355551 [Lupinus albus]|uniref:Uncharacterized protein n=1 Tax=Lupinus albus TaxID=3870 RepID=A0A6A4NG94_LUPAL|nr:hypothetical protein Lalb_Chr22g0355551 [Lupinus albus]